MTTWQVSGIVTTALYDFGRPNRQGLNNDICLIQAAGKSAGGRVENRLGAREHLGPPVGIALCGFRYRFDFAAA